MSHASRRGSAGTGPKRDSEVLRVMREAGDVQRALRHPSALTQFLPVEIAPDVLVARLEVLAVLDAHSLTLDGGLPSLAQDGQPPPLDRVAGTPATRSLVLTDRGLFASPVAPRTLVQHLGSARRRCHWTAEEPVRRPGKT